MDVTERVIKRVENAQPRIKKILGTYYTEWEDVKQDIFVHILEHDYEGEPTDMLIDQITFSIAANYRTKETNRRRLEEENADTIVRNSTPTLSDRHAGGVDEFIDCEQTLARRWRSLSPFLQTVAKRQFFGYEETVEKTARDLGTTVAAINMARTRIKQVLNGVDKNG